MASKRDRPTTAYFDEFVFRFNRRRTRHAAFRSLLGIGTRAKPVTYKMLISPEIGGEAFIISFGSGSIVDK